MQILNNNWESKMVCDKQPQQRQQKRNANSQMVFTIWQMRSSAITNVRWR